MTKRAISFMLVLTMFISVFNFNVHAGVNSNTSRLRVVLEVGEEVQLRPMATIGLRGEFGTPMALNFSSTNEDVAVVDNDGFVTATGYGTTQIFYENEENNVREFINVVVVGSEEAATLRLVVELNVGDFLRLDLENGESTNWTSSDENILAVDEMGQITYFSAVGEGLALVVVEIDGELETLYVNVLGEGANPPSSPNSIVSIYARNHNSFVLTEDGELWGWGTNARGQLGDGTTTDRPFPVKIMDNVAYVSASGGNTGVFAITETGELWGWGNNQFGQLGDGTTTYRTTPVKIMDNVAYVTTNSFNTFAITETGELWGWGNNINGAVGVDTGGQITRPVRVMTNVAYVSQGDFHTAAITESGQLYMWGTNFDGRLGDGTTTTRTRPVRIMTNVASVSLGASHTIAITQNGELWAWGVNTNGQLGDGTTTRRTSPVRVMTNVSYVSALGNSTFAINQNGELFAWGSGANNILGLGGTGTASTANRLTPQRVMTNVASVHPNSSHTTAITQNDELFAWGSNTNGQLGDGTTTTRTAPVSIMNNVASVSTGSNHTLALTNNGYLYSWGLNSSGQLGDGTTMRSNSPIRITLNNNITANENAIFEDIDFRDFELEARELADRVIEAAQNEMLQDM